MISDEVRKQRSEQMKKTLGKKETEDKKTEESFPLSGIKVVQCERKWSIN